MQSCAAGGAGLTNCGVDAGESCCASLEVEGGTFYRTYTNSGGGPGAEADPASVSSFRLDKYLVTVGRFRQFVNAIYPDGGATTGSDEPDGQPPPVDVGLAWEPPPCSGKHRHLHGGLGLAAAPNVAAGQTYEPGWIPADDANVQPTNSNLGSCGWVYQTWTNSPAGNENLPVDCITWEEAYAFCIWDGGFLPSEAEWEYAAAGGSDQREYPWGSTDPGSGNQYAIYGCYYPTYTGGGCPGVTNIAPVGSTTLGAGRWGQLDLAGEEFEWNLDGYAPYADPCTDCAYLTATSSGRAIRGGAFVAPVESLLSAGRLGSTGRNEANGFRCARAP